MNLKIDWEQLTAKRTGWKKGWTIISIALVGTGALVSILLLFFTPVSSSDNPQSIWIDRDDNIDSVKAKIERREVNRMAFAGWKMLAGMSGYGERIATGHYVIEPEMNSLTLLRRLKGGMQTPVKLTIASVRTREKLAADLAEKMMMDSTEVINALRDSSICAAYGLDTANIIGMFLPNTYEIYWNVTVDKLMKRMKKESEAFWTDDKKAKATRLGLTPEEVITLASIIDEETANNGEKPDVAGMYLNRIKQGMPLQADPTVKFALQQFHLRRIYHSMLTIDNPYNTYNREGLPPGPIRIPSMAGINAVLNATEHDYLYMCAKEDFSGTHRFAKTYSEHLANAKRYTKALNERGVK